MAQKSVLVSIIVLILMLFFRIFVSFQVRTKDRTFESVSHLIDYHRDNNLPIISAESALRLVTPVHKGGIRR